MVTGEIPFSVTPPERDRDLGAAGAPLLFNVKEDPNEMSNLAAKHPATVDRMQTQAERWFQAVCSDLDVVLDRRFPDEAGK